MGLFLDWCHQHPTSRGHLTEWLRWWTRNPLGNSRVGSNPAVVAVSFFESTVLTFYAPIRSVIAHKKRCDFSFDLFECHDSLVYGQTENISCKKSFGSKDQISSTV